MTLLIPNISPTLMKEIGRAKINFEQKAEYTQFLLFDKDNMVFHN